MKNAKNRQMRLMTVEEVQAYLKKNQTIILPYELNLLNSEATKLLNSKPLK